MDWGKVAMVDWGKVALWSAESSCRGLLVGRERGEERNKGKGVKG